MKEGVRNDTNSDINSFDIVLDARNSFLNVLEWCIIGELLPSIINLALNGRKTIVDLLELSLEVLNILADSSEARLDVSQ